MAIQPMSQLDRQNLAAHTDAAIELGSETFLTLILIWCLAFKPNLYSTARSLSTVSDVRGSSYGLHHRSGGMHCTLG